MSDKISKQQFEEIFKKATVTFSSYYKYTFYYVGEYNGYILKASYGRDSSDIYKHNVDTKPVSLVNGLWTEIEITKDGKEVYYEYRW